MLTNIIFLTEILLTVFIAGVAVIFVFENKPFYFQTQK